MSKFHLLLAVLFLAACPEIPAKDIRLTDDTLLEDVKLDKITQEGIYLRHKKGIKRMLPRDFPDKDKEEYADAFEQYKQKIAEWNLTQTIAAYQAAPKTGIAALKKAIEANPQAPNLEEAKKLLAELQEKTESDVSMAVAMAANEKDRAKALAILEYTVKSNPNASNLKQAQAALNKLKGEVAGLQEKNLTEAMNSAKQNKNIQKGIDELQAAIKANPRAKSAGAAKKLVGDLNKKIVSMHDGTISSALEAVAAEEDAEKKIKLLKDAISASPRAKNIGKARALLSEIQKAQKK